MSGSSEAPIPLAGVAGFNRNQWQLSIGISGNLRLESVAGFDRNQWQPSRGIRTATAARVVLDQICCDCRSPKTTGAARRVHLFSAAFFVAPGGDAYGARCKRRPHQAGDREATDLRSVCLGTAATDEPDAQRVREICL